MSCTFSQDVTLGFGANFSGTMSATANHFKCSDRTGGKIEIELISIDPSRNAYVQNGKVAIRTKDFGTVFRGNEQGKFDQYEMTDNQIKKLKAFLGF